MLSPTAEELYRQRAMERQDHLDEAFKSARLTIPSLIPDTNDICERNFPITRLKKPFQSIGARGVNNLASKLLITLLPPTAPFMKYELSGEAADEAAKAEESDQVDELKALLARRETRIQSEVDVRNLRSKGFQVLRHLLAAGNVLVYLDPADGALQVFPLFSYTVKRDGKGNVLDIIYVEKLARETIEDKRILNMLPPLEVPADPKEAPQPVLLFTRIKRESPTRFRSWQEVKGQMVPDTEETWTPETLPWLALRMTAIDGEDYGRGYVEEYRGDLTSYEQLRTDTLFTSANAAKLVWAINPNSPVKVKKFVETPNGGAVAANPEDIQAVRVDKANDLATVAQEKAELRRDIEAAFLLNSSFQRAGERVTAEEIRRMAEELEDTLGGVFSLLSQEFQLPLARLLESSLIASGDLEKLPKDATRIGVVTGLAAIGRGQELQRLNDGLSIFLPLAQVFPELPAHIDTSVLNRRIWNGAGVDTQGLVKPKKKVEEELAAQQQAASQQVLGQELAKGAGKVVGNVDPQQIANAAA